MSMERHSAEQIIHQLRQAEVEIAKGISVIEERKQIGVVEQTYYRWCKEYGGLKSNQAKRLENVERDNARLKRLLADASRATQAA